jgi:hypothetical protein
VLRVQLVGNMCTRAGGLASDIAFGYARVGGPSVPNHSGCRFLIGEQFGVLSVTEFCPISAQGCASSLRHDVVE